MIRKQIFISALFIILFSACNKDYSSTKYLKKVLNNIDKIESASYTRIGENWNPGDTAASHITHSFVKEYNNPLDTTIGASFVLLNQNDTTISFCYDGQMRALVYSDEKRIVIDSFTARPLPFRPLTPPFYNYVKSIIKYTLTTKDSIELIIAEQKEDIFLKLIIYENEQIEFFGKAYHMPPTPYTFGDNTSIYKLWINKKTDLPYKVRREMSHNTSVTTCKNPEFNKLNIKHFNASDYFPEDYTIHTYRTGKKRIGKHELLEKKAPNWILQTSDKSIISLNDLKSRVLMIQFTSVSCGPCRASIPFLKELSKSYNNDDFDFVAIECTTNNTNVLKSYLNLNKFEFKLLLSTKDILKSYSISSYPVFFILDENRIIRYVINGYSVDKTDEKIKENIEQLL